MNRCCWIVISYVCFGSALFAQQEAEWKGKLVFLKEVAVPRIESVKIDRARVPMPAMVQEVRGDWLWVERAWVQRSEVRDVDQAFDDYTERILTEPFEAAGWVSRAAVWRAKEEFENALNDAGEALKVRPHLAWAYYERGLARHALGDAESAISDFTTAIRFEAGQARYHAARGEAWLSMKDFEKSLQDYQQALVLDPDDATVVRRRGIVWYEKRDCQKALEDFTLAQRLAPVDFKSFAFLAAFRASCYDPAFRDARQALALAHAACEMTQHKDAYALRTLAAAYAETGDWANAILTQEKALACTKRAEEKANGEIRLASYREQRPYRREPQGK
jgi:tetratricopeptide (TPR) repeat protein